MDARASRAAPAAGALQACNDARCSTTSYPGACGPAGYAKQGCTSSASATTRCVTACSPTESSPTRAKSGTASDWRSSKPRCRACQSNGDLIVPEADRTLQIGDETLTLRKRWAEANS